MRRTWLRGKENVHKRYLVHVAGHNLGLVMRLLPGAGTPRWLVARGGIIFWLFDVGAGLVLVLILLPAPPPDDPTPDHVPRPLKRDPRRTPATTPLLQRSCSLSSPRSKKGISSMRCT
jgi:hypothetical protein